MPGFVNMTKDHSSASKEMLNSTVHSVPVVTVVAIGATGRSAAELMQKESSKGNNFSY